MVTFIGYWFSVVAAMLALCGLTGLAVYAFRRVVNQAVRLAGVKRVADGLYAEDRAREQRAGT